MGHPIDDTHMIHPTADCVGFADDVDVRERRARRWARRKGGLMGHRHENSAERSRGGRPDRGDHPRRGGHGGGGQRARRGAVPRAILALLDERPMHGYELITEMSDRSGGRWQPSPGTIYPALNRMEERGLIEAEEVDGKRRFSVTDSGRSRLAEFAESRGDDARPPWDEPGASRRGDLRGLMAELAGQGRQIGRFGTPEQADAARAVLEDAKRKLYGILAESPPGGDTESDSDGA